MTATDTTKDFEQLLVRLERNHTCVLRLTQNLNSYRYEPKNYECFVKLRELRTGFSKLAEEQKMLLYSIKHHTMDFEVALDQVEKSIKKSNGLEQGMAAYLLEL